jgi:hypothetical protein
MRIFDELTHDLKYSIFEALVLKDLFDGDNFIGLDYLGFKDHSEASIAYEQNRKYFDR